MASSSSSSSSPPSLLLLLLLALLLLSSSFQPSAAQTVCKSQGFTYSPTLTKANPLRGFVPYLDNAGDGRMPCSLEYTYIAMNTLMTGPDTFDFSFLEDSLDAVAAQGKQLIFRLYLDHPDCCPDGEYHSGVPSFLTTGNNSVTLTPYDDYGGGMSPDYDNPRLVTAMVDLIEALAEEYDGDPRIAFIKVGLLGFWGEFHTYPYDSYMASRETQLAVIGAFNSSFTKTRFLVSIDELNYWDLESDVLTSSYSIGYHDDSFLEDTYSATAPEDWYWYPRAEERNLLDRYLHHPFGGEVYPDHQAAAFLSSWNGMSWEQCVEKTHASWLLNQHPFDLTSNSVELTETIEASLLLGYQFYIQEIRLVDVAPCEANEDNWCGTVELDLQNKGSAPFYYPVYLKGNVTVNGQATEVFSFNLQGFAPAATATTLKKQVVWADPVDSNTLASLSVKLESPMVLRPIVFAHTDAEPNGVVTIPLDIACQNFSSGAAMVLPGLGFLFACLLALVLII